MSFALLQGEPFRIDPDSVQGGFRVKTAAIDTQGGRVVQVLGTSMDSLTVTGSFGRGGFPEQRAFLARMTGMAIFQNALGDGQQIRFQWPDKGWDFSVRLRAYASPNGPMSVHVAADVQNPKWTLSLYVIDDNNTLKTAAAGADQFIARLSAGIGWRQTIYNGPDQDWRKTVPPNLLSRQ